MVLQSGHTLNVLSKYMLIPLVACQKPIASKDVLSVKDLYMFNRRKKLVVFPLTCRK